MSSQCLDPCPDRVCVGRRAFSYIGDSVRNLKFLGHSDPRAPDSGCTMGQVKFGPYIGRDFYRRPCLEVASEMVGLILVRRMADGQLLAGQIVEVEAYLGGGQDPASHAQRGETPRNRSMFGPPGRLYVYRSYGIHDCANLVCEPTGTGAAVLLRAVEPLVGIEQMRRNRSLAKGSGPKLIAAGPGRLTQAFAIGPELDGRAVARGQPVALRRPPPQLEGLAITRCPRIGISKAVSRPYRFCANDNRYLSKPIPKQRTRSTRPTPRSGG